MSDSILEEIKLLLPSIEDVEGILELYPPGQFIIESSLKNLENLDSEDLLESLRLKLWESINTGKFSDVSVHFRQIYSLTCFLLIYKKIFYRDSMESCFEILDFSILIGSIENLYKNASKFVDKVTEFLEEEIGQEKNIDFPIIEKLERLNFNSDIPIENCPSIESFYKQYFLMEKPAL
uniref:Uncharacterized protein n=1 Tax=Megaselia scalaris TaxID=36166 RepID=T1GXR9_MEGSC